MHRNSLKLADILGELRKEVERLSKSPINAQRKKRSLKQATAQLLIQKYSEAILILERILKEKEELRELLKKELKARENPRRFIDPVKAKGQLDTINRQFELMRLLELDIKTLYEWTYQIKGIFTDCRINIDLSELERISRLRGKFITHISEQPLFLQEKGFQAGTKSDLEFENFQILFHPLTPRKAFFRGIKSLVKSITPLIPELKNEDNHYEQIYIIYRNLSKLSGASQEDKANAVIKRVGLATEAPALIAKALLKALKDYRRLKRV